MELNFSCAQPMRAEIDGLQFRLTIKCDVTVRGDLEVNKTACIYAEQDKRIKEHIIAFVHSFTTILSRSLSWGLLSKCMTDPKLQ